MRSVRFVEVDDLCDFAHVVERPPDDLPLDAVIVHVTERFWPPALGDEAVLVEQLPHLLGEERRDRGN